MYTVYMHVVPNGKVYIGITKTRVNIRWQNGRGYRKQLFGKAVKKYGWENIEHIIIKSGIETEKEALDIEAELIAKYDSTNPDKGYNVFESSHADGGILKVAKRGEEHYMWGKKLSESHKQAILKSLTGTNNPKARSVTCITTGEVFGTVTEASLKYGIATSAISKCANGKLLSAGKLDGEKLVWKYTERT